MDALLPTPPARAARVAAGKTAAQAAAACRITAGTLRQKEASGTFTERQIRTLARFYGCDWTVFLPHSKPDSRRGDKRSAKARRSRTSGPRGVSRVRRAAAP